MWQVVKPLRPHPLSIGQARNFCTRRLSSVLDGRDCGDVVADAAIIASELVTNAVSAGSSLIELLIALTDTSVRIEVLDDAGGDVIASQPAPTDPKGRGLMIVAALARDWGVVKDHHIKHVWAEIAVPAPDRTATDRDYGNGAGNDRTGISSPP